MFYHLGRTSVLEGSEPTVLRPHPSQRERHLLDAATRGKGRSTSS